MPINPLSGAQVTVTPPQLDPKAGNKPLSANKSPAETQPVAKDTVTISKAATALKTAPEPPRVAATKTAAETDKVTRSSASQAAKFLEEQAAAVETKKTTAANSQESRGAARISRMI